MSDLGKLLDDKLKDSMRARDEPMLNLVRMLKTKMMERRTAPGFSGTIDDALWLEVISAYAKSAEKAVGEFEKVQSETAREQIAMADFVLLNKTDLISEEERRTGRVSPEQQQIALHSGGCPP